MGGLNTGGGSTTTTTSGDDNLDTGGTAVSTSAVEAPFLMDTADITFVGPIDIVNIKLSIGENMPPPGEYLSTRWEVELIADPSNVDATNAHGGNNRRLKVIKNSVIDSNNDGIS